jgi:hypothetical protein
MHYYAIYYLCIAAGLEPEESYKIAYSSQYVDDALWGDETALILENGKKDDKPFDPIRSAHNGFESMGEGVQEKIYFPFHFLPGLEGESLEEKVVTKNGDTGALFQTVIDEALKEEHKNLFRIGITLHVLADTFSHENFSGLWSSCNNVQEVSFVPIKRGAFSAMFSKIKWRIMRSIYNLAPAIGHGRAGTLPDYPHMNWSFRSFDGHYPMVSNNTKFYIGMMTLYDLVITKIKPKVKPRVDRRDLEKILWRGVSETRRTKKNCKFWIEQIKTAAGQDLPEEHLDYDHKDWEKQIGKWRKKSLFSKSRLRLNVSKDDFEASNFKQFHNEGWKHRIYIMEILRKRLMPDSMKKYHTDKGMLLITGMEAPPDELKSYPYEGMFLLNSITENLERYKNKGV